ncbi:prepilin peptidase [Aeromicrobium ginsengisoli]|uniref:Prepilin peptidase n=1 Tax=Aeromicrobium ginsengisoli TaxID=363867 RepID=A0A5M4FGS0_9ACTN|nr:A24 family peptidase [Aeromicrobium ginsengisoli]KAA1399261.1 prepilin peptidase [Aeromicrobium ginsengisoli]
MTIAIVALAAALIGAAGPWVLRRMPEPPEPDEDKVTYADLSRTRGLAVGLAIGAALMAGIVAWKIEPPELLPVWVLVTGVGSWLVFIDWRTRLLPYVVVAPTYLATYALVGLGAILLQDVDVLVDALVANIVVYVIFRVLYAIARGAFGFGDVRLSAVLATALGALGTHEVLVGMYAGFLLGAVFGLVLSRLKIVDSKSYAFGPYMVVGAVIGAAWGPALYGS